MFVLVDITDKTVASVARCLSGVAGTVRTDSISLQHWLLRFGAASAGLQKIVGGFGDWKANICLPWADYRVLMSGHLIGLDK